MGKKKFVAVTKCDFGEKGREDVIRKHYSIENARRGFKETNNIYGRLHGWKCWIEYLPTKKSKLKRVM